MSTDLGWYVRRLRQMSPSEVAQRAGTHARQKKWATRQVRQGSSALPAAGVLSELSRPVGLHQVARDPVPTRVRAAVHEAADQVLAGTWPLLGVTRTDLADPDWFADPVTGHSAPSDAYAFRIDHRDETVTGNVKMVWELSRHHHLTVLAAAWSLTGEEKYADAVDLQLRSWWRQNPFLSGIHWTSGIELGVRLISWVWIRRLMDDWPKVQDLFEHNQDALRQIRWHQEYLDAFRSTGSSANNHAVAEAAGLLVAACAFPWFEESPHWRETSASWLRRQLRDNTFDDGLNRELATDYHRFVTELALVALTEARASGHDLGDDLWALVTSSLDAAAALLDVRGRAPRQGDGDEGRSLVLDGGGDPWALLLSAGAAIVGRCDWWPVTEPSLIGAFLWDLASREHEVEGRPAERPRSFPKAGLVLLRTPPQEQPEIWCRCDGGPHGFLSIAAHAHADALSVEVRHDGVDVLTDPGTYCYHGEPRWRQYFRSTLAHNTVCVDDRDQSVSGGPFLWTTQARTTVLRDERSPDGGQVWAASHDGYSNLPAGGVRHRRVVHLEPGSRSLTISDHLTPRGSGHTISMPFHLGPEVSATLEGSRAELAWHHPDGLRTATLELSGELAWSAHHGESEPPLGWYAPAFGKRVPTTALVGRGHLAMTRDLCTVLTFHGVGPREELDGRADR